MQCPWGEKCFSDYLGDDKKQWEAYDASILAGQYKGPKLDLLVDQGAEDNFLHQKQLLPERLVDACAKNAAVDLKYTARPGYDHSYYFIATFMKDHVEFHAKHF